MLCFCKRKFQTRFANLMLYVLCYNVITRTYPGYNYSAPYWMGEFGAGSTDDEHYNENWLKMLRFLEVT